MRLVKCTGFTLFVRSNSFLTLFFVNIRLLINALTCKYSQFQIFPIEIIEAWGYYQYFNWIITKVSVISGFFVSHSLIFLNYLHPPSCLFGHPLLFAIFTRRNWRTQVCSVQPVLYRPFKTAVLNIIAFITESVLTIVKPNSAGNFFIAVVDHIWNGLLAKCVYASGLYLRLEIPIWNIPKIVLRNYFMMDSGL